MHLLFYYYLLTLMFENGPGKEPDSVGLERVDSEAEVIALRVGESVAHLEAGEHCRKFLLGQWSHDGKDELKVFSQHLWVFGPEFNVLLIANIH